MLLNLSLHIWMKALEIIITLLPFLCNCQDVGEIKARRDRGIVSYKNMVIIMVLPQITDKVSEIKQ